MKKNKSLNIFMYAVPLCSIAAISSISCVKSPEQKEYEKTLKEFNKKVDEFNQILLNKTLGPALLLITQPIQKQIKEQQEQDKKNNVQPSLEEYKERTKSLKSLISLINSVIEQIK